MSSNNIIAVPKVEILLCALGYLLLIKTLYNNNIGDNIFILFN